MGKTILRTEQLKAFYVLDVHGTQKVVKAVDGVDLDIRENEVYGIAGESGCGKTTLLKALAAAIEPPLRLIGGKVTYRVSGGGEIDAEPLSLLSMPDGTSSALVQGRRRVEVVDVARTRPYLQVRARVIQESPVADRQTQALMRSVLDLFDRCVQLDRSIPEEAHISGVVPHDEYDQGEHHSSEDEAFNQKGIAPTRAIDQPGDCRVTGKGPTGARKDKGEG